MNLPAVALSINQPWAHLIAAGLKPIENRNWNTEFRGEFLIHAGKTIDKGAIGDLDDERHPVTGEEFAPWRGGLPEMRTGGMIGIAEVVDVIRGQKDLARFVTNLDTSWFVGKYGFVIANARPIEFIPCVGALGFFKPNYELTYTEKPPPKPRKVKAAIIEPEAGDLFA
jgi:hypothetical protein